MKKSVSSHSDAANDNRRSAPILALICAVLFWSGNFIVGRAIRGDVNPLTLNYWRWLVALAILLPLGLGPLREHRKLLVSSWVTIVFLGLTGIATFHICVYTALRDTTAVNALIILSIAPVVIALSSWCFLKETITRVQASGIVISLLGAIVLIAHGNVGMLLQLEINKGDAWMLLAVPLWSAYSILLKKKPDNLPQMALLTGCVIVGIVFMTPFYMFELLNGSGMFLNAQNVMAVLYIGIFASVIAFFFWNYGVSQIGPKKAGMYIHLMPFFGSILSIIFLGEGLAAFHFVGAALVFSGIALTNRPTGS